VQPYRGIFTWVTRQPRLGNRQGRLGKQVIGLEGRGKGTSEVPRKKMERERHLPTGKNNPKTGRFNQKRKPCPSRGGVEKKGHLVGRADRLNARVTSRGPKEDRGGASQPEKKDRKKKVEINPMGTKSQNKGGEGKCPWQRGERGKG